MGKGYFGKIEQLYYRQVDALGLAFFRIAYSLVLLLEVKQLFTFRSLIFSEVSTPAYQISGLLLLWMLALGLLLVGWFTRAAAILNYAIGVFIIWQMPAFKYHLDFVMTSVNFLLLFLPVSASLSLDIYFKHRRHHNRQLPNQVSSLYVWVLVIVGVGLVYLDSAVNKLSSPMWLSGLGFWLPSSLPQNAQTNLSWLLNQEILVRFIGYGILAFEMLFLFLIWFRPLRWLLLAIGILLHLGIGIAYPIPNFALLMLALYIPLLPDGVWQKLRQAWGRPKNGSHPEVNPSAVPETAGELKRKSRQIAFFILYALVGQVMCILATPLFQNRSETDRFKQVLTLSQNLFKPFYFINQKFLGIVGHDVFLDKHFAGYDHIINISYVGKDGKAIPLPLFTQTGQPGSYSIGRVWTKWAYRVTGPHPDAGTLQAGIKNFTSFWAHQQHLNLEKAVFLIRVKKIAAAHNWEKDFLNRQMQQPWKTVGRVYWHQQQYRVRWFPAGDFPKEK